MLDDLTHSQPHLGRTSVPRLDTLPEVSVFVSKPENLTSFVTWSVLLQTTSLAGHSPLGSSSPYGSKRSCILRVSILLHQFLQGSSLSQESLISVAWLTSWEMA